MKRDSRYQVFTEITVTCRSQRSGSESLAGLHRPALGLLLLAICAGIAGCGGGSGASSSGNSGGSGNPAPTVTSISPNSAPAGALAFTLTVNGSNFVNSSTVQWNGNSRTTTFVSSSQLQVHILAADLASPGKVTVIVVNPPPGGGTSTGATFTVAVDMIAFHSSRALDGSNAANTNRTRNIWVMNADGSNAAALTKLTAAFGDSVGPVWSPDGSKIIFESGRALDGSDAANTATNIWVINADGSNATALTKLAHVGSFVSVWSRDGSKIAYESSRALDGSDAVNTNNTLNIWLMNADGSSATALTKFTAVLAHSFNPVWSRDGGKIAFLSNRALDGSNAANNATNIWVMNADGSNATALTKLTALGAISDSPLWSPDGSKIAFDSSRALDGSDAANTNNTFNIWLMNADGSIAAALTRLTASGASSGGPVWSPDGSKIAYASSRALDGSNAANNALNIWVMNADGSNATALTKLTAMGASSGGPVWSPDGSKIAYASSRALDGSNAANTNNTTNIWVMNADGSNPTALTKLTAMGAHSEFPTHP